MTIGLVVVTFNSAALAPRLLAAVASQQRRPERLIVVDNGSADGTAAVVAVQARALDFDVEIVALAENTGFAHANNIAVAALDDCDYVALLNPDAFPEPAWLERLAAAAERHPDAGALASRLMRDGAPGVLDGAGDACHVSGLVWRQGHGRAVDEVPGALDEHQVFSACAAAALYRRLDWVAVGGFDERYFCYVEDVDLGFRLRRRGRTCWYVPDAVAWHVGSALAGVGSAFAVYHGHRNLTWTFVKNMPGGLVWRYAPSHLLACAGGLVWFAWRGQLAAYLRAKRDAVSGLPAILRQRRAAPPPSAEAVRDIRSHLAHGTLLTRRRT